MTAVMQGTDDGLVSSQQGHVTSAKEDVLRHTISKRPKVHLD